VAKSVKASPTVVLAYRSLFVNRLAYTMQSLRPHPESGRHYYFRPKKTATSPGGEPNGQHDPPSSGR
jgi:hypothetical protein